MFVWKEGGGGVRLEAGGRGGRVGGGLVDVDVGWECSGLLLRWLWLGRGRSDLLLLLLMLLRRRMLVYGADS